MRNKYSIVCLTLLLSMLSSGYALAEDKPVMTHEDRDDLVTQNALLELRVKNAELQAKLLEIQGKSSEYRVKPSVSVPSGIGNANAADVQFQPRTVRKGSVPAFNFDYGARVLQVAGVSNHYVATVRFSNGTTAQANVGSRVTGLGTVRSIRVDEVLVDNGRDIVSVPFLPVETATPSQMNGNVPGVMPGSTIPALPALPTIPSPTGRN